MRRPKLSMASPGLASPGRFLGVVLLPGEEVLLSHCALANVSLVEPDAGRCSVLVGGRLLCGLSADVPQVPVRVLLGDDVVVLRCEGVAGAAGVHVIGRLAAGGSPPPKKYRPATAAQSPPAAGSSATARRTTTPSSASADRSASAKAAASPRSPGSGRTPKLTFNPEVLVAEYVPKRCGISPGRWNASLEEMVARQAERALEEEGEEEEEEDNEVMSFEELMRQVMRSQSASGAVRPAGTPVSATERLADLIMREQAHQQGLQQGQPGDGQAGEGRVGEGETGRPGWRLQ